MEFRKQSGTNESTATETWTGKGKEFKKERRITITQNCERNDVTHRNCRVEPDEKGRKSLPIRKEIVQRVEIYN
jgi:hypothetical protein